MLHSNNILLVLFQFSLASTMLAFQFAEFHTNYYLRNLRLRRQQAALLGSAKMFSPFPDEAVIAQCEWIQKKDTVENRIPPTITETFCRHPNDVCLSNSAYGCGQVRTKMEVAYRAKDDHDQIAYIRNITISMGCSCIRRQSAWVETFLRPHLLPLTGKRSGGDALMEVLAAAKIQNSTLSTMNGN